MEAAGTNAARAQSAGWPQWMCDVAEIADGIKARAIKAAAARPVVAAPAPAPFDIEAARAELAQLVAHHDAAFNYSDDYTFWRQEQAKADRIASLRGAIARHEAAGAAA